MDDDHSKTSQQPAVRHPTKNMEPPCCPSAVLVHEEKSDDHAEKMNDCILKGKDKKRQNILSQVTLKWSAADWEKLYFSDLVASAFLDNKGASDSQQSK